MVDGNVFHHQINKKLREKCSEQLLAQFPCLLKVDSAHVTGENWKEWLDAQVAEFGEFHEVEPLKNIQMEDPIDSLLKLNPNSVVAVI